MNNNVIIHNEYFEMIHFMKRREEIITTEEYLVYEYMFNLMKSNMNEKEKEVLKQKKDELDKTLLKYYDIL